MKQTVLNAGVGFFGASVSYLFGGWNDLLGFFLMVIVVDYLTGCVAAVYEGKGLSSQVGFKGLLKKAVMVSIVVLAHRMDMVMDTSVIQSGAIYFYLANELVSITENCGRAGLPLPDQVKKVIATLKDRGDSNNG